MNYAILKPYAKQKECFADTHHSWKGDAVGYKGVHAWVRTWIRKYTGRMGYECEFCGYKQSVPRDIHLANISGNYERDFDDYFWLCADCHREFDKDRL